MSDPKRSRRHFTTEQKVALLKRHLVDKVAVSDLCNQELASSVARRRRIVVRDDDNLVAHEMRFGAVLTKMPHRS